MCDQIDPSERIVQLYWLQLRIYLNLIFDVFALRAEKCEIYRY